MTLLRAVIAIGLTVALLVIPGHLATAQPAGAARVDAARTVTLITGDRVRLTRLADGRQATTVEPGGPASWHGYRLATRDGDERGTVRPSRLDRTARRPVANP